MSERQKIVNMAVSYLGYKESDGSHRKIIDIYNAHKPLARGYKVKYTDAWCATFVSAMAIKCGITDIIPTECGCGKMIELFKKLGAWQESDAHVPQPGDVMFYDWDDSGKGDTTGDPEHVGIVEKVSGNTITVIEGNYSNSVKRRTMTVNGKYIRGYGVPKYAEGSTNAGNTNAGSVSTGNTNTGTAKKNLSFTVGDEVQFTGSKHYANANASTGPACKPGKAKVTAISKGAKHPYHLVRVSGAGSTVYGWVDEDDVKACSTAQAIKVGDVVQFAGGPHYANANASTHSGKPKAGPAKVTAISKGAKHPYHVVHTNKQSDVYGWVDADKVSK